MFCRFWNDRKGQFAMMTAFATVPLMGALALAVDYTELSRQRQNTLNALDAAGIATARQFTSGKSDEEVIAYANSFFKANLNNAIVNTTTLQVTLPNSDAGGGTLKLQANLKYQPYFFPGFIRLLKNTSGSSHEIDFSARTEIRLKNTLEVALVLDNSGSMQYLGAGSSKKRIDLLKDASKQLIDTLAIQATQMKQVDKAIQFSLVPFASAVNVGPSMKTESWMDTLGLSPVHHENFDWSTMGATNSLKRVEQTGGAYYKRGLGWGLEQGQVVTRFTLFDEIKKQTGSFWNFGSFVPIYSTFLNWKGCVESRPHPYNTNDAPASTGIPSTLYVPMFAPDETDRTDSSSRPASNNWWIDVTSNSSSAVRQRYMPKYFTPVTSAVIADLLDTGPNFACSIKPITPLTDLSKAAGVTQMKTAIDAMEPDGATNVPEGIAWGWRTVSSRAPFTEGRPETERGNDKVVILLTDGANTYYHPNTVTAASYSGTYWNYGGNNNAGSNSTYSAYGYASPYNGNPSTGRIFQGTSNDISKSDFSNANYGKAMNEQMAQTCTNAKAEKILVFTIALDLDPTKGNSTERALTAAALEALEDCASNSRVRPSKLFWNTKGNDLEKTFREIGEELSNLRIVG